MAAVGRTALVLGSLVLALALLPSHPTLRAAATEALPSRLTDAEYWGLVETFSEPAGYFQSDNLVSNEVWYQWVIPALVRRVATGGVYMGVGPEQNFSYIAAVRPEIVFITDIRRGNLHTQLMYKALFELSADRADFVSRLFTKPRPEGLGPSSTAADIFNAYWDVETSAEAVYEANLQAIQDHLTNTRALPLSAQDLDGIGYVYFNFYWFGPSITYSSSTGRGRRNFTTYYDLMVATDDAGVARSYLASEASFAFLKDLHARNLVVPVVGDLAGPKAMRAVGDWVRAHGAVISTYYLSNVEQYLYQDGKWPRFCANVATLPLDDQSTFIRSVRGGGGPGGGLLNQLGAMHAETRGCAGVPGGT